MRKLDRKESRRLEPVLSLRKRDLQPLPDDRFVKATIPLYYQGHSYREGSRIRVLPPCPCPCPGLRGEPCRDYEEFSNR